MPATRPTAAPVRRMRRPRVSGSSGGATNTAGGVGVGVGTRSGGRGGAGSGSGRRAAGGDAGRAVPVGGSAMMVGGDTFSAANGASAAARSSTRANRLAGFFDRHRMTAASSPGATAICADSASGSSVRTRAHSSGSPSAS